MDQGNIFLNDFIANLRLQNGFHLLTRLMRENFTNLFGTESLKSLYQMLIGICYLIYNGLLQTQNDGTTKSDSFSTLKKT
jgi:hypothetical protein